MSMEREKYDPPASRPLFEFGEALNADWNIINDGVMGGRSQGRLRAVDAHHSAFEGVVSLANNGGFTSMVTRTQPLDLSEYAGIRIHARPCTPAFADRIDEASYKQAKTYMLRLKIATQRGISRFSYEHRFEAPARDDAGQEPGVFDIPLEAAAFTPVFRGRQLRNVPALDTAAMRIAEVGFMIRDGQEGSFCLELGPVELYQK